MTDRGCPCTIDPGPCIGHDGHCLNCGDPLPEVQPDSGTRPRKHCSERCRRAYAQSRRVRVERPSQHKGSVVAVNDETIRLFWSRVRKSDRCWEWTAARNSDGYGYFSVKGYSARAHRWSYELAYGPIPAGQVIDHRCQNRACVRPDHLQVVGHGENVALGWRYGNRPGASVRPFVRALYAAPDLPKAPAPLPCGHDDSSQWADHLRGDTDD